MNRWKALILAPLLAVNAGAAEGWLLPRLRPSAAAQAQGGHAPDLRGVNALGNDPAGLVSGRAELFTQYQPLAQNMAGAAFAASLPMGPRGSLAVDVMNLGGAAEESRDASGNRSGSFRSQQRVAGLAAALRGGLWSIGAEVKRFDLRVGSASEGGWLGDAGLRLHPAGSRLTVSLTALNFSLGGASASAPTRLGAAARLRLNAGFALSAGHAWLSPEKEGGAAAGLEWSSGESLALRSAARSDGGVSAGFGLRLTDAAAIDYAFDTADRGASDERAANHRLSLTFRRAAR